MKEGILKYLGYKKGAVVDNQTLRQIDCSILEVEKYAQFKAIHLRCNYKLKFIEENVAYREYLGNYDYFLVAYTLGFQIDRYLQRLQICDMRYALIFNAAASRYVEVQADKYDNQLTTEILGFRFCPGYGGTSLYDNLFIASELPVSKIGISFLESGVMVPSKSMIGVLRIGEAGIKSCRNCVAQENCSFRAQGNHCY